MRTAVLAAIALAVTATVVSARPEPVQTAPSLRAQSWNLEIAARRPAMRARVSHGELKTKTLVAKHFCPVLPHVGLAHRLRVAGSPPQWLSRSLLRSQRFTPSRAPPIV